jgi:hypothetical protein
MHVFRGKAALAVFACVLLLGSAFVALAETPDNVVNDCKICAAHGMACNIDTDADRSPVTHGCCAGVFCAGNSGEIGICCQGDNAVCMSAGKCGQACPAGTRLCTSQEAKSAVFPSQNLYKSRYRTCVPDCTPPQVFDPISCSCVAGCPEGHALCGTGCCGPFQECATPQGLDRPMICCSRLPFGKGLTKIVDGACGDFCVSQVKALGGECCRGGPQFDPTSGKDTGQHWSSTPNGCCAGQKLSAIQTCCGGSICSKVTSECVKGVTIRGRTIYKCEPKQTIGRPERRSSANAAATPVGSARTIPSEPWNPEHEAVCSGAGMPCPQLQ